MIDQTGRKENRAGECRNTVLKAFKKSVYLLTIVFLFTSAAFAQLTTADIVGTVTDATGAVLPNAKVDVKNLATSVTRSSTTDDSGNYTFTLLQPGHYSITITAQGFKVSNI